MLSENENESYYFQHKEFYQKKNHKYHLEHRKERDKFQEKYRKSEHGKEVRVNNILTYSKQLKYEIIDIIPESTWKFVGIKKVDFHHINNILITALPERVHDKRLGKKHRELITKWFTSIHINLDDIYLVRI